ncbi:MAG: pyridoxamine 5'-phosphate oxidase family protein [Caulobacter sp.]
MEPIASVQALEACIGVAGLPVKMKIIDHIDETAAAWIKAAPVAFIGIGGGDGPRATLAGGEPGFASAPDRRTVVLPLSAIDAPGELSVGDGLGLLFLAPGVGETLRANGRVAAVSAREVRVRVEECFVHCAKALIRSDFWAGGPAEAPSEGADFLDASRFLALVTMDASGRIDVSPKGDPAGLLVRMDQGRATLAERPGNRLAFGYRNMIEQPKIAALAVIPGSTRTAVIRGRAQLTADETLRSAFVVEGKTPILATVIEPDAITVGDSGALARAGVWSRAGKAEIDAAATLLAHIKLNKARGAQATLMRLAVRRDLVAGGLESNYKTDLY